MSLLYHLRHEAVEECHNQRVDVRTIDIGIGHDDNLVVTQFIHIRLAVAFAFDLSTDVWVNFKLFGGMGLMLVFVLAQGMVLSRYIQEKN